MARRWFSFAMLFFVFSGAGQATDGAIPPGPPTNEELRAAAQLVVVRQVAEAETRLTELIERAEGAGDPLRKAVALSWRGLAKVAGGDSRLGVPDFELAAELFGQAGDSLAKALTLLCLGKAEQTEVRLADAERHLRQAIEAALASASSPEPRTMEGFFLLTETFGARPELAAMKPMGELMRPLLGQSFAGLMRSQLASVLLDLDRLDEAERELLQVQQLGALLGGFLDGDIEEKLGHLRRRQGRWDEARGHYQRALEGAKLHHLMPLTSDDRVAIGIRGYLAELELLAGRVEAALGWNDEALAQARKDGVKWLEGSVLGKRAEILVHEGRYSEARAALATALAIARETDDDYRIAMIEADLGDIDFLTGAYAEAAVRYERAFALLEERGDKYLGSTIGLRLAQIYQALETTPDATGPMIARSQALARESDFQLADLLGRVLADWDSVRQGKATPELLNKSVKEFVNQGDAEGFEGLTAMASLLEAAGLAGNVWSGGFPGDVALPRDTSALPRAFGTLAHLVRGLFLVRQENFEGARLEWEAALDELAREGNSDLSAILHGGLAAIHVKQGRYDLALAAMRRANGELETAGAAVRSDDLLASYFGSARGPLFDSYLVLLLHEGQASEAFEATERARARAFLQQVGNRRLGGAGGSEQKGLLAEAEGKRALLAQWQRELATASPLRAREIAGAQAKVRAELQGLLVRLEATNPEYAEVVSVAPSSLAEIQAAIEQGTNLISYFQVGKELHAWVVDRTRLVHVPLPVAEDDLAALADFAVAVTEPRGAERIDPPGRSIAELSARLYGLLIAPIRGHLTGNKLILVPHGPLHAVPFAALQNPESGHYLIQDFTLVHAPSASVLPHLAAKESPVEGRALVLGAPPRSEPGLGELPGAADEARFVAQSLGPGSELCLGAEATEGRLATLERPVDLIHVAAHAVLDTRASQFSRLVLAPGDPKDGFDGNLEVHELLGGVDWSGVNLVVLSACETARGERTRGDEIVGLTRAVLYAGSPGVISTLWPIDDGSAISLMTRFYHHLMAGETAAQALRAAQLETLALEGTAKPFHWAAFTLHGDPRGRWGRASH